MVSSRKKQFKIFNSIIGFNAVNVMDYFFLEQVSSKILFHNKTMFIDISSSISKWMFRAKNHYISISTTSSIIPFRIMLLCKYLRFAMTLMRAKVRRAFSVWFNFKYDTTSFAFYGNKNSNSIFTIFRSTHIIILL